MFDEVVYSLAFLLGEEPVKVYFWDGVNFFIVEFIQGLDFSFSNTQLLLCLSGRLVALIYDFKLMVVSGYRADIYQMLGEPAYILFYLILP